MPRPMRVGTLENNDYQISTVRQRLRIVRALQTATQLPCLAANETIPLVHLRANLSVIRWSQDVYSQPVRDRSSKRAAMARSAWCPVVVSPIRIACFPVDMLMCEPQRLNIHPVEHRQQSPALICNWATTRRFG